MTDKRWVHVRRSAGDTAREAADKAERAFPTRGAMVLDFFYRHEDGATDDDLCAAFAPLERNQLAPHRTVLKNNGYLRDSGRRVLNVRGNRVKVWEITGLGLVAHRDGLPIRS